MYFYANWKINMPKSKSSKNKKRKSKISIQKIKELLKQPLKIRSGVQQTKVFKDKSKYTRKKKHKGEKYDEGY